jgi:hypothetical protein
MGSLCMANVRQAFHLDGPGTPTGTCLLISRCHMLRVLLQQSINY